MEKLFVLALKFWSPCPSLRLTFVSGHPILLGQKPALLVLKRRRCDIKCTRDISGKIEGDTSNWLALRWNRSCSHAGESEASCPYRRQFSE